MFELLLYSTLSCPDADAMIFKIEKHKTLKPEWKLELVETVKESVPECYWGETTEGTGRKSLVFQE
tara:strand:- start:924 stop:1121 length:198 start_codon:yes stop_codon:yes gene_type:complete